MFRVVLLLAFTSGVASSCFPDAGCWLENVPCDDTPRVCCTHGFELVCDCCDKFNFSHSTSADVVTSTFESRTSDQTPIPLDLSTPGVLVSTESPSLSSDHWSEVITAMNDHDVPQTYNLSLTKLVLLVIGLTILPILAFLIYRNVNLSGFDLRSLNLSARIRFNLRELCLHLNCHRCVDDLERFSPGDPGISDDPWIDDDAVPLMSVNTNPLSVLDNHESLSGMHSQSPGDDLDRFSIADDRV